LIHIDHTDLSHMCNHNPCLKVYDMTLETNAVNHSRHHFKSDGEDDLCTTHDSLCELYKARITKKQVSAVLMDLMCVHLHIMLLRAL